MFKRLAGLMAGACLLGASTAAIAHDSWIARGEYRNPVTGEWCCGKHECFPIAAKNIAIGETGYEIRHLGESVPHNQVMTSEDNQYWRCHRHDGTRRCFFAPRPGS